MIVILPRNQENLSGIFPGNLSGTFSGNLSGGFSGNLSEEPFQGAGSPDMRPWDLSGEPFWDLFQGTFPGSFPFLQVIGG